MRSKTLQPTDKKETNLSRIPKKQAADSILPPALLLFQNIPGVKAGNRRFPAKGAAPP
jgi:hypothetical protein